MKSLGSGFPIVCGGCDWNKVKRCHVRIVRWQRHDNNEQDYGQSSSRKYIGAEGSFFFAVVFLFGSAYEWSNLKLILLYTLFRIPSGFLLF